MNVRGKTIIVTGASSGIGEAAARRLASEGAAVVLGARRKSRLDALVSDIRTQGGSAESLVGDVADEGFNAALVELAENRFDGLHAAFNNAGVMGDMSPVSDMKTDTWRQVIDTNLTSAFFAAKYQIPALLRAGGGTLLFTSSFVGHANGGLPGMAAYAASKAGLIGLVRSLAAQHGADGIRVNALLPGGTRTEMSGDDPDVTAYVAGLHALRRMASADEIAQVAVFLLSDAASFVTGSAMTADGGVSVRLA